MPKLIDREEYRGELLARAVEYFAEHGYAALSMKQLADVLGISHGLFYHYFTSKEALFLQMTQRLANNLLNELLEQVEPGQGAADRLDRMLARAEERQADLQRLFLLINDYARLTGAPAMGTGDSLAEVLRSMRAALRASLGISEAQMRFLFTYALGMMQERAIDPDGMSFAQHRRLLYRMFTRTMLSMVDDEPVPGNTQFN